MLSNFTSKKICKNAENLDKTGIPCHTRVDQAISMEDGEGLENASSHLLDLRTRQPFLPRFRKKFTVQMPQNDRGQINRAQGLINDWTKERRLRLATP